jgi:hypothetical protein
MLLIVSLLDPPICKRFLSKNNLGVEWKGGAILQPEVQYFVNLKYHYLLWKSSNVLKAFRKRKVYIIEVS